MYLKEPIYLSGSGRRSRRSSPLRQIANILFISLIIGVNYLVFFHAQPVPQTPVTDRPGESGAEPNVAPEPSPAADDENAPEPAVNEEGTTVVRSFEGKLRRGDTVFAALVGEGLSDISVAPVLAAMKDVFDFRKAQVGHEYRGSVDASGKVQQFEFQTGPLDIYQVAHSSGEYSAIKKNIPVDRVTTGIACTIDSSLYASLTRCGEGPQLAALVTDLFEFDVDFFQEIRRGDVIRLLVDKVYVNGRFLKYEQIKAARYEGKFSTYGAYYYQQKDGQKEYFTASGRALRKEFLKTPLKYTRISSGYTQRRMHPTLHRWKRHLAIDYAAPINTPVQAVASGTVKFVGKKGASGNLVIIEHSGGYMSYYAHLNRFGRIEIGDQVGQRTLIGYVGRTGRATGPHLHFALKYGRKWVNPLKVEYTTANPITSGERSRFHATIGPLREQLQNTKVQGLSERQG